MEVFFWFRKSEGVQKKKDDLLGTICCRIKVNGQRTEIGTTKVTCFKSEWDSKAERVRRKDGRIDMELTDNSILDDLRSALHTAHMMLVSHTKAEGGKLSEITCLDVKRVFMENQSGNSSFRTSYRAREIFQKWLEYEEKRMKGGNITQSTLETRKNYIQNVNQYLQKGRKDLQVKEFDSRVIDNFRLYLASEKGFKAPHITKHLQAIKQAFIWAKSQKLIKENPLADYRIAKGDTRPDTTHLTVSQIKLLVDFNPYELAERGEISSTMAKILDEERDAIVFQCVTGMHDVDYKKQKYSLFEDEYGYWLVGARHKTGEPFKIPLDPLGIRILNKYGIGNMPKRPNQKRNQYLKLLGSFAKVGVRMSTKIGRKSFANRALNDLDYDPLDVAQMLGHRDLKSLKHYVSVQNKRLASKFKPLDLE